MSIEDRLVDALATFDRVQPAPDLFARVQRSLEAERAHRARVTRWCAVGATAALGIVAVVAGLARTEASGVVTVPLAPMQALEVALLGSVVAALAPLIRRPGAILVGAVFRAEPATAPVFLRLLDTAYHLVVAGYVLVGVRLPDVAATAPLADALQDLATRVAGLLLLVGVLHSATIAALPLLGLLHASAVRRHRRALAGPGVPPASDAAERADRVARIVVWLALGYVTVQLLLLLGVAIGLGIGG